MNLKQALRLCAASVLLVALATGFPSLTRAQGQGASSLEGLWLTDGYGQLLEFHGDELRRFEITTLSCVPTASAKRQAGGSASEIIFGADGETIRVTPGTSPETRWLHGSMKTAAFPTFSFAAPSRGRQCVQSPSPIRL